MRTSSRTTTAAVGVALAALVSGARAQEPNFGRAVALTETELFVGQPVNWYGPGVVYVYRLDASGEWLERSRLLASDSARKDDFGRTLALDGNTLIVGAPRKRDGSGVAYVFERASADADWRQVGTIEPPGAGDHTDYASAMALAGDDLFVGSPAVDSTGVVYHLRRTTDASGVWDTQAVIRPPAEARLAGFGRTMSQDGDWLLVGAPAADSGIGRVFVSRRQANGEWSEPSALDLSAAAQGGGDDRPARVGSAVLLDGNTAYVGASGAAVVVVLEVDSTGAWAPVGELQPFDAAPDSRFGHALAVVDGELWVGAPGVNDFNGSVYRFAPNGRGGWRSAIRLDADSADGTSWPFAFGYSIAAAGERAVVGMPTRDFGEGRALAVAREGDDWQARQLLEGEIYSLGESLEPGARCEAGRLGEFPCANIELVAHMPVSALGGERGVWVNDIWGWTDLETSRDYALVARRDGASFVDVTDPARPRLIGNLPRTEGSPPSVWRDIKVLNDHAYIVSDGARAHGMQVFDLTRLRTVADTPAVFGPMRRTARCIARTTSWPIRPRASSISWARTAAERRVAAGCISSMRAIR